MGFDSGHPAIMVAILGRLFTCASFTKQCKLVTVEGQCHSTAGKVSLGLASP